MSCKSIRFGGSIRATDDVGCREIATLLSDAWSHPTIAVTVCHSRSSKARER